MEQQQKLNKFNDLFKIEKYTNLRHELHKIPELNFQEHKTKTLLLETIKKIPNFEKYAKLTEMAETGFIIDVYGNRSSFSNDNKKTLIAIRTDMDGLPLEDKCGESYASTHHKHCHACGHDGHMSILTSTLEYFLSILDKIPNNFGIRFLYQPAEEGLVGAVKMIEEGCLENIDYIYGLHNVTVFDVGTIGVKPGAIMARNDTFNIEIKGQGGHGSAPCKSINPITPATNILNALNQLPAQEMPSTENCVISIGRIQAGDAPNVLPETANLSGTIRTLNNSIGENMGIRVRELSENIAKAFNCEIKGEVVKCLTKVLMNTHNEAELIKNVAMKHFKYSKEGLPIMASEDFAYFTELKPGCFFMLGCRDDNHQHIIHSPYYDFNDRSLVIGVEFWVRLIEKVTGIELL